MKILVLGVGKIGATVAYDLANRSEVAQVGIVDVNQTTLDNVMAWIQSGKVVTHRTDITDHESAQQLLSSYDVCINTLPNRYLSYKALEAAIEARIDCVDILEEYHRRPDLYEIEGLDIPEGMSIYEYGESLHERAVANGVTILDGMGFAPGLSNVTVGEGIRKLDTVHSAVARVGGIPTKEAAAKHPLRYMITWAFGHVLREYVVRLNIMQDGEITEVDALTGRESFTFDQLGKLEQLEAAITPGMPSMIFTRPDLQNFSEKTIRWPGHYAGIDTLKECGLLDLEPVDYDGKQVVPRELLTTLLAPRLRPSEGETDNCVMWNTVSGTKNGQPTEIHYYLWDEADTVNNISSMARVTGFTAASSAVLLAEGAIVGNGIVAPEDGVVGAAYDKMVEELNERGIQFMEIEKPA